MSSSAPTSPFIGLLFDEPKAVNEFSLGLSATCPLYESSSDLLLLRVEGGGGGDHQLLAGQQRRYLNNCDPGVAHKKAGVFAAKMAPYFEQLFQKHKYIDIK